MVELFFKEQPNYRIVHDNLSDMSKVSTYGGTYQKGAWVLHMLRARIGDESFWKGIQSYYKKNYNSSTTVESFKIEMETASGQELDAYFDQWLYKEGNPAIDVKWSYNSRKDFIQLDVKQVQTSSSVFKFPIEIKINFKDGNSTMEKISLNEKSQQFRIALENEPSGIEIDPNTILVADWTLNSK